LKGLGTTPTRRKTEGKIFLIGSEQMLGGGKKGASAERRGERVCAWNLKRPPSASSEKSVGKNATAQVD